MSLFKTTLLPVIVILLLVCGQVGFKALGSAYSEGLTWQAAWNSKYTLLFVLFLYGIATILWIYLLSYMDLSKAFMYYGLTFVFIPLISALLLKEQFNYQRQIIASALIIAGIIIATYDT